MRMAPDNGNIWNMNGCGRGSTNASDIIARVNRSNVVLWKCRKREPIADSSRTISEEEKHAMAYE